MLPAGTSSTTVGEVSRGELALLLLLLQPAGRLVMVVERFGAQQELGLRAVAEPEAGVGPQVDLGLLSGACG